MTGAEGVLIVNIGLAVVFAVGYAILAFSQPSQRSALGFSASYVVGLLSPLSDLLAPVVGHPALSEWASYVSFLLATLSISLTFNWYHGWRAPWRAALAILAAGLVLRAAIGVAPRDTLAYGLAYQTPFVLAAALAMRTVLAVEPHRPLPRVLAGIFGLIALDFLTKPFLALALGSGRTLTSYHSSLYAVASQASTGLLLLAAGIVLMLVVAKATATASRLHAA